MKRPTTHLSVEQIEARALPSAAGGLGVGLGGPPAGSNGPPDDPAGMFAPPTPGGSHSNGSGNADQAAFGNAGGNGNNGNNAGGGAANSNAAGNANGTDPNAGAGINNAGGNANNANAGDGAVNSNAGGNANPNAGPGNSNAYGNANPNAGPGNNNAGGNANPFAGPGNNNAGGNANPNAGPGNNNAGGNAVTPASPAGSVNALPEAALGAPAGNGNSPGVSGNGIGSPARSDRLAPGPTSGPETTSDRLNAVSFDTMPPGATGGSVWLGPDANSAATTASVTAATAVGGPSGATPGTGPGFSTAASFDYQAAFTTGHPNGPSIDNGLSRFRHRADDSTPDDPDDTAYAGDFFLADQREQYVLALLGGPPSDGDREVTSPPGVADRADGMAPVDGIGPVIWEAASSGGPRAGGPSVTVPVPLTVLGPADGLLTVELPWGNVVVPLAPLAGEFAIDLGGVQVWADQLLAILGVEPADDDTLSGYSWLVAAGLLAGWGAYTVYHRPHRRRYGPGEVLAVESKMTLWEARTLGHGR